MTACKPKPPGDTHVRIEHPVSFEDTTVQLVISSRSMHPVRDQVLALVPPGWRLGEAATRIEWVGNVWSSTWMLIPQEVGEWPDHCGWPTCGHSRRWHNANTTLDVFSCVGDIGMCACEAFMEPRTEGETVSDIPVAEMKAKRDRAKEVAQGYLRAAEAIEDSSGVMDMTNPRVRALLSLATEAQYVVRHWDQRIDDASGGRVAGSFR